MKHPRAKWDLTGESDRLLNPLEVLLEALCLLYQLYPQFVLLKIILNPPNFLDWIHSIVWQTATFFYGKIHHFQWVTPLFQWQFSIAPNFLLVKSPVEIARMRVLSSAISMRQEKHRNWQPPRTPLHWASGFPCLILCGFFRGLWDMVFKTDIKNVFVTHRSGFVACFVAWLMAYVWQ